MKRVKESERGWCLCERERERERQEVLEEMHVK